MKQYNVLWLEDEPEKFPTFEEECREDFGLILHCCKTRAEGVSKLENNIDYWDAILLDAKMPELSMDEVATTKGMKVIEDAIARASLRRHIPHFISTGQPDLLSNEVFKERYGDFYRKTTDDERLMQDMIKAIEDSPKQQVITHFHEFFNAVEKLGMDEESKEIILSVLLPMQYPAQFPQFSPKLYYNQLRQLLEFLFRACGHLGIIPDFCVKDARGKVNLNQCSIYLAGKECDVLKIKYGESKDDRIIPQHIESIIRSVLEFGNIHSHTTDMSESDTKLVEKILESANSRFLIFAFALQLMQVVIWFDELNDDILAKRKILLPWHKIEQPDYVTKYCGKTFTPVRDEKGFWHCDECSVIIRPWNKTQIVLTSVVPNINDLTKDTYRYYATFELK
ncbi:MAG: hypothetical protein KBS99_08200 [Prevotellaceae bacterium]|nr:hypothetical protein [Candidatus Colivivens caballi]